MASDGVGDAAGDSDQLPDGRRVKPHLEIAPRAVARAIADGEPMLLVDCRREDERRFCSIEGSVHVPMNRAAEWIDELREDRDEHPPPPIVVFCHHGVRSMQVVGLLQAAGFPQARSMAGGIDLWSVSVDPGVPRY